MRFVSLLFAILMIAWTPTQSVDLSAGTSGASGTASWIACPNDATLDDASDFNITIDTSIPGYGWYAGSRTLLGRWGATTAKRQFLITVVSPSVGYDAKVSMYSSTNVLVHRTISFGAVGRRFYQMSIRKQGTSLRAWVDGFEVAMGTIAGNGDGPIPAKLKTIVGGQPWTVGDAGLLRGQVTNWVMYNRALSDAQEVALWAQDGVCDLTSGSCPDPEGTPVSMGAPPARWHKLGTGDALPNFAPTYGAGSCVVACAAGTGCAATLSTKVPTTPVVRDPLDTVVEYRFIAIDGKESTSIEPRTVTEAPAVVEISPGVLLGCYGRGSDHSAGNMDLFCMRSMNGGLTWPSNGGPWPGSPQVEWAQVTDQDPVQSEKGAILWCSLTGRCMLSWNHRDVSSATYPDRHRQYMYTDDQGDTWSTINTWDDQGTFYGTVEGSGGKCLDRSDGSIACGYYRRDLAGSRYCSGTMISTDNMVSFHVGPDIACDVDPYGRQYEEPNPIIAPDGSEVWLIRTDDTKDILLYRSLDQGQTFFTDYGDGRVFDGWNGTHCEVDYVAVPPMMICGTRRQDGAHEGVLFLSDDSGHTWAGPIAWQRLTDGFDDHMGHSFVWINGKLGVLHSQDAIGGQAPARLEWAVLRSFWR